MSLLSIAQAVATNVSVPVPNAVLSNPDADYVKIVQFSNATGEELARRVDWAALRATAIITGTGTNDDFSLPNDFLHLTAGNSVTVGGNPVRVGLSPDEWNSLTPVEGIPRYARLIGNKISFYPFLASGVVAKVLYQSKSWCPSGTAWGADTEEALIPEPLIQQGTIWRWRRQMGQDFQDYLAEYESAIASYAKFDDGMRIP